MKLIDITEHIRNGKSIKNSSDSVGLPITRIETISDGSFNQEKLGYGGVKNLEKIGDYWLQDGDILMSHINSPKHLGKSAIFNHNGLDIIHGMNLLCIRPKKDAVIPEYLNYFFLSKDFDSYIKGISNQSVNQASFASSKLKKAEIPLPSLEEQKAIVAKLDRAQRLIDIDRQMLTKYDDLIQSIFLEMFGDPVTNPKGWEKVQLKNITKVNSGSTPSRKISDYYNGKIYWVKTTEVKGEYIFRSDEKITQLGLENSSCKIYPVNTILVAMYGQGKTRGKVGLLKVEAATNQACAAIYPCEKIIPDFLFNCLKLQYDKLRNMGRGGNQPNLNVGMVKRFEVMMPPVESQKDFERYLQNMKQGKTITALSSNKSEQLFSSLLEETFSAKVTIT